MKRIFSILFLFFICLHSFAQIEKYSQIKITADKSTLVQLMTMGIAAEDGYFDKKHDFIINLSEQEITKVSNAGLKYVVLIDDVKKFYRDRFLSDQGSQEKVKSAGCYDPPQYPIPAGFHLGTMGGFYTYQQILAKLDTLAQLYPNLISAKQSADTLTTIGGRTLYYVRISNNPNVTQNKPQVLYTALTHAREGAGMQQLFYYICYLLENYNTNNDIKNLVDNTEMYFIPCVNPDGYVYNESTDPTGGGMWRKNRKNNGNGSYGIDINRNFGYEWGYDNSGSSPNGSDDTYRGAYAFSERESQIVRDFCNQHQIKITINHHTFGNDFIYPWGYIGSTYTPDSTLFRAYAQLLTKDNYFAYGTCDQTLGYITNGSADDWMYGYQVSKPKIISMTPESGEPDDGFWPVASRIPVICSTNVSMNLMAAKLVGKYAVTTDISPVYISQQQGFFDFSIERLGLDSPAVFTVTVQPITLNIVTVGNPVAFSGMTLLETRKDSVSFTLNSSIHNGDKIKYLLKVDNGLYSVSDTITKVYGPSYLIFSDNCDNTNNWPNTTGWDVTTEASYSPPTSITDSPYSNYSNSNDNTISMMVPVNLVHALSAYLSFECKWSIEPGTDYAQVQASIDNGATWTALCGKYTKPGSSSQAIGEPLYDGFQGDWVKEQMGLDDYVGHNVLFQFSMVSDNNNTMDGFYFDDFKVYALYDSANAVPEQNLPEYFISSPMPNPATDIASINYRIPSAGSDAAFELTDMTGRIIFRKKIESTNGSIKINSSILKSGLYHYSLHSANYQSEVRKLVISH